MRLGLAHGLTDFFEVVIWRNIDELSLAISTLEGRKSAHPINQLPSPSGIPPQTLGYCAMFCPLICQENATMLVDIDKVPDVWAN